jgi:hypothetical protein
LVAAALLAFPVRFQAHDVITTNLTFSRDVSRIFASRCLSCHGSGSTTPLSTYSEARPWAVAIKEQVLSRAMPPWGAVKGFGNLSPDNAMTQEEIMIIAGWVVGGAPEGNPAALPMPSSVGQSSATSPLFSDAVVVQTRARLVKSIEADGIKPLESRTVSSAKVTARLPGGEVMPLLWLNQFDGASKRTFTFRSPLDLPAGTIVESSNPLRFALETHRGSEIKVTKQEQ